MLDVDAVVDAAPGRGVRPRAGAVVALDREAVDLQPRLGAPEFVGTGIDPAVDLGDLVLAQRVLEDREAAQVKEELLRRARRRHARAPGNPPAHLRRGGGHL